MGWQYKMAVSLSVHIGILGLILTGIWLYWSIVDYAALNASWTRLMALSHTPGVSTQRLVVAIADQDAHRLNMVAEIAGKIIGALIAAVGGLGLVVCLSRRGESISGFPVETDQQHRRRRASAGT